MKIPDFSLAMYAEICKALQSQNSLTVRQFIEKRPKPPCVVLRHDVDRRAKNALAMARLENKYGISSTYYFRYPKTYDAALMREIQGLGHEIGYHYEVLDKARGDQRKAVEVFQNELEAFRRSFPVSTVCAHGNPLTKWDGRELWRSYPLREFGIIGEAYLSLGEVSLYLTDTGRSWNGGNNLKDKLRASNQNKSFHSTADIIEYLKNNRESIVYLNCHPERWPPGIFGYLGALLRDVIFGICKKLIKLIKPG
ncbi:MAG: hypothetical protein ACOX7P_02730 [Oscillospiraceae bacterium]